MARRPLLLLAVYSLMLVALGRWFILEDPGSWNSDYQYVLSLAWQDPDRYREVFALPPDQDPLRSPFPPLLHRAARPLYAVLGVSPASARTTTLLFLPLWVFALYGLGRHFGGVTGGLATAGLGCASPHVVDMARRYYLDFPQAALTAAALAFLLETDGFRKRTPAVLFAVTAAAAVLTKWTAAAFLAVPLAWEGVPALASARGVRRFLPLVVLGGAGAALAAWFSGLPGQGEPHPWAGAYALLVVLPCLLAAAAAGSDRRVRNLVLAAALGALLAAPWFLASGSALKARAAVEAGYHRSLAANASAIGTVLVEAFPFAPLFLAPGLYFAWRDPRRGQFLGLLAAVGVAAAAFTLLGHPIPRYSLTFLAFLAPLGGFWIRRPALVAAALALGIVAWSAWLWVPGLNPVARAEDSTMAFRPTVPAFLSPPPPRRAGDDLAALADLLPREVPPGSVLITMRHPGDPVQALHQEQLVDTAFRTGRCLGLVLPVEARPGEDLTAWFAGRPTPLRDLPRERVAGALVVHREESPPEAARQVGSLLDLAEAGTVQVAPGRYVTVFRR